MKGLNGVLSFEAMLAHFDSKFGTPKEAKCMKCITRVFQLRNDSAASDDTASMIKGGVFYTFFIVLDVPQERMTQPCQ